MLQTNFIRMSRLRAAHFLSAVQSHYPVAFRQWTDRRNAVKIKVTSIYVDDQEKALRFYTGILGFVKKADFTNGPFR